MSDVNRDQAEYWNGEVGQRWAASQTALDAIFAPLTAALFERAALSSGERVLDIGCGAGQTALIAARTSGSGGRVLAADLSAPLLAVARQRAADGSADRAPIDWVEADAQNHDFDAGTFDHALSRFGVMFFADPVAAFANIGRALAPEGRLTFLCWRAIEQNAWVQVPRDVVLRLVPALEPVTPDAPGPFRFADRAALARILEAAGFRNVACEPLDRLLTLGRSSDGSSAAAAKAAADFVVDLGPVARLLRERPDAVRETARSSVIEILSAHAQDGAVRLGAACWLVSAIR